MGLRSSSFNVLSGARKSQRDSFPGKPEECSKLRPRHSSEESSVLIPVLPLKAGSTWLPAAGTPLWQLHSSRAGHWSPHSQSIPLADRNAILRLCLGPRTKDPAYLGCDRRPGRNNLREEGFILPFAFTGTSSHALGKAWLSCCWNVG